MARKTKTGVLNAFFPKGFRLDDPFKQPIFIRFFVVSLALLPLLVSGLQALQLPSPALGLMPLSTKPILGFMELKTNDLFDFSSNGAMY